jgi:predicted nucleotidyltransferase
VTGQRTDRLLVVLQDAGFAFVVVGGVAAIAHGATRSTKDLDVVAPMTAENLARLLGALQPYCPRHLTRPDLGVVSQSAAELSTHRLLLLVTDIGRLDVLGRVDPIGAYSDVEAVEMELVVGRRIPVITLDQLIDIKAWLRRPQDKDVEAELRLIRELRDGPASD